MLRKRSAIDFQFGDCIGEGSYSKVFKAISIHNRKTYAIKILSKTHIQRENKRKYVNIEKDTLNILGRHPGIVTLYYTFQDDQSLYFVIDFAKNGELLSLIRRLGSLSEALTKYYMIQLIDAVEFIHSKGIIHRDLKPENILLNHEWKLMITDFGTAKILNIDESDSNSQSNGKLKPPPSLSKSNGGAGGNSSNSGSSNGSSIKKSRSNSNDTSIKDDTNESDSDEYSDDNEPSSGSGTRTGSFVGTAEYVSPELLKYNICGFECDLWAIGCILYQLIVGRPPFKGNTEYLTFEQIIALDYEFPQNYIIPENIKSIVQSLLVLKPENRLTIPQLQQQSWFQNIDWNDKNYIWKRKVPKLEGYNPRLYQTTLSNNLTNGIINNNSNSSISSFSSKPIAYNYVEPGGKLTSKVSSMPRSVLTNQIKNAQNNPHIMNKVLNNRLDEKNKEIREMNLKNTQRITTASKAAALSSSSSSSSKIVQPQPQQLVTAPLLQNKEDIVKRRNSLQFANGSGSSLPALVSNSSINDSITPPESRSSSPSISSMKTSGTSKSVIKRSDGNPKTPPLSGALERAPLLTSPSGGNSPSIIVNKKQSTQPMKKSSSGTSSSSISPTQQTNNNRNTGSSSPTTGRRAPSISEMLGLPQPSSAAVSAAGAIGNMLSHNRTMKSSSGVASRQLYQQQQQQQIINPILLDKTIPKDITNKLMANEYILKLDNIFKSELIHKTTTNSGIGNTTTGSSNGNATMALDDSLLNKIITENYQKLNRDLKSCILIITSMARLLIYELNSSFTLQDPQSSTRLQAMDFYSNIVEIRLTNKNVSMYDYEFDEDSKEGYLILELVNVNKLIFLSAYNHKTLVRGGINSNVRVGFTVNEEISWIDSLLKAKELLRQNNKNKQQQQSQQQPAQQRQVSNPQSSALAAATAAAGSPSLKNTKSSNSSSAEMTKKNSDSSTTKPTYIVKRKSSSSATGIVNGTKGLSLDDRQSSSSSSTAASIKARALAATVAAASRSNR